MTLDEDDFELLAGSSASNWGSCVSALKRRMHADQRREASNYTEAPAKRAVSRAKNKARRIELNNRKHQ